MWYKRAVFSFIFAVIFVSLSYSQGTRLVAYSNNPSITNNEDAIAYLMNIYAQYPKIPHIGRLDVNTNQIKLYNPLNNERIDCVHISWSERRTKIDDATGYPTNIDIELSILLPFNVYLRNYRNTLDNIKTEEEIIELLQQSDKFSLKATTGINVIGDNFDVRYSSPGYIGNLDLYKRFRDLLDIQEHRFPNHNILNLTNRTTVADSLGTFLNTSRPYGYDQGRLLFLGVFYYGNKTYFDISKIGNYPPFNIEHYRNAMISGLYSQMRTIVDNLTIEISVLYNESEQQMLNSLPRNNNLSLVQRQGWLGNNFYMGINEFVAFLKRSIEFSLHITNRNNNDANIDYQTPYYYLISARGDDLRNINDSLTIINTAIENGLNYVWRDFKWNYE